MSVFTKTGDQGTTSVANKNRISKNNPQIHALGDLDELSCWLGWTLCYQLLPDIRATLSQAQVNVQRAGSLVAGSSSQTHLIQGLQQHTQALEEAMEDLERTLPPLKDFILPGGTPTTSTLHLCRAICRRAERSVVALLDEKKVDVNVVTYLNRLSDYLFVCARCSLSTRG